MTSKKKIGIVLVIAVLAIIFMTVAFLTTQTNTDYYTQIDNRWVTDIAPVSYTHLTLPTICSV